MNINAGKYTYIGKYTRIVYTQLKILHTQNRNVLHNTPLEQGKDAICKKLQQCVFFVDEK